MIAVIMLKAQAMNAKTLCSLQSSAMQNLVEACLESLWLAYLHNAACLNRGIQGLTWLHFNGSGI